MSSSVMNKKSYKKVLEGRRKRTFGVTKLFSYSGFDKIYSQSIDNSAFLFSGLFIICFVLLAVYDDVLLSKLVSSGFFWSAKFFGPYWQILLVLTFFIGLFLAQGKTGDVFLGGCSNPEIGSVKWVAIIAATLLGGGGIFWAVVEPMAHYMNPPPLYGSGVDLHQRAVNALTQSFFHWSFPAWSIVAGINSIILMHLHYDKGLPLKPRILLYPIFGERILNGYFGGLIDAFCILSAVSGTIGPIGFLALQLSHGLNILFGYPNSFQIQALIILFAVSIYILSSISGLTKGLQLLSRCNAILVVLLMFYILILGPSSFIIDSYIQGLGCMISNFLYMSTYRGDPLWLAQWTLFFWGWFIGFSPMMGILIARVSKGRNIRQLILTMTVLAPLSTCFWFANLSGVGLASEVANPGSVIGENNLMNLPVVLLAVTQKLPLPVFSSLLFLLLALVFILTMGDSMTYTISVVLGKSNNPNPFVRIFWGIMIGAVALILISIGSGGISALQSFIVITAVPVSLILITSLWKAPKIAMQMAKDQILRKEI